MTGRLECFWQVVLVDEAAGVEEPRISWMIGWMERPRGLLARLGAVMDGRRGEP
jgi:hypothetical protein